MEIKGLGKKVWMLQNKISSGIDGFACGAMGTSEA